MRAYLAKFAPKNPNIAGPAADRGCLSGRDDSVVRTHSRHGARCSTFSAQADLIWVCRREIDKHVVLECRRSLVT